MLGHWIAPVGLSADTPNAYFRAQRQFQLEAVPVVLEGRIACDGLYRLEINGHYVCRGPARGTRSTNYMDVLNLSPWLRKGDNVICATVRYTTQPLFLSAHSGPGFWMELGDCLGTDDSWSLALCDSEWPRQAPWYAWQLGACELHDLRHAQDDQPVATRLLDEDDPVCRKVLKPHRTPMPEETPRPLANVVSVCHVSAAPYATTGLAALNTYEEVLPLPQGDTTAEQLAQLTLGGRHQVILQPPEQNRGVSIVFDFDKEISGRFEMEVEAPDGAWVDLCYEEALWKNRRLRADHTHTNETYQFCDRIILRNGANTVTTELADRGFRMVQVTFRNLSAPLVIHKVQAVDRRYPMGRRSSFFCGDYKLNRLWDMAMETLSACTTDIYTDCPWRERLFYINDFAVTNRTMLTGVGDYRLAEHALEMALDEMQDDDLITCFCPGIRWSEFAVILSAHLTLPLVLRDTWLYSGDDALVKRHFPKLKHIMKRFGSWLDDRGIIQPPKEHWNFFDWSYELNGTSFNGKATSLLNYMYLYACRLMDELAPAAGEEPVFSQDMERLQRQTLEAFWSDEDQCLLEGKDCQATPEMLHTLGVPVQRLRPKYISRLPHALAILSQPPEQELPKLVKPLLDTALLTPDFYYLSFILDALAQAKLYPELMDTIRRYWNDVLDSGSPTIWENGVHDPGKEGFGGSASLCHAFSTSPLSLMQRLALGIVPTAPGFATFDFLPRYPELKFARGRVPTPHGTICAQWQNVDGTIHAELDVPPNCIAHTPAGNFSSGHVSFSF